MKNNIKISENGFWANLCHDKKWYFWLNKRRRRLYLEWIHVNEDSFHITLPSLSLSTVHSEINMQSFSASFFLCISTQYIFVKKVTYLSTKVGAQELLTLDFVCPRLKEQNFWNVEVFKIGTFLGHSMSIGRSNIWWIPTKGELW